MNQLLKSLGVGIEDEKIVQQSVIKEHIIQSIRFIDSFKQPIVRDIPILSTQSSLSLLEELFSDLQKYSPNTEEYQIAFLKYLFFKRICGISLDSSDSSKLVDEEVETVQEYDKDHVNDKINPISSIMSSIPIQSTSLCPLCGITISTSANYHSIDEAMSKHLDSYCRETQTTRKRRIDNNTNESNNHLPPAPLTIHRRTRSSSRLVSTTTSAQKKLKTKRIQQVNDDEDEFDEDIEVEEAEDNQENDDDNDDDNDDEQVVDNKPLTRFQNLKTNPEIICHVHDDWEENSFFERIEEYQNKILSTSIILDEGEDGEVLEVVDLEQNQNNNNNNNTNNTNTSTSHNDQIRLNNIRQRKQLGEVITPHESIVEESTWNSLYDYQKEGVKWLWNLYISGGGSGGILGDEMGLGKTVQLCTHYNSVANEEMFRLTLSHRSSTSHYPLLLVVCPATIQQHWLEEFHRWAPRLRVIILHSISSTFAALSTLGIAAIKRAINKIITLNNNLNCMGIVMIVSYDGLRTLQKILLNLRWVAVCLDEGQKIKNPDTNITHICKDLPTYHRIILSGTPIQNSLKELWSLFDFVFPGKLGTLTAFETEFATPIRSGGYSNASKLQTEIAIRSATTLQLIIKPYLLRRKKDDVMNTVKLPEKTEQVLFCVLSRTQREIYKEIISSPELERALRLKGPVFSAIMTLRKLCNHPVLAYQMGKIKWYDSDDGQNNKNNNNNKNKKNDNKNEFDERIDKNTIKWCDSGKLLVLSKILPLWQAEQHKVLIFCQMHSMLSLIEVMLSELSLKYMRLDGTTPVNRRQNIISHYNSPYSDIFVLLLTTRTGGVGISLTAANRVVLVDPDWNPQIDIQARERAWRIGQKREVTIYRLITKGTIEEKIYHRQIFKLLLTNRILENPKQKRFFSKHEIQELFELGGSDDYPVDQQIDLPLDGEIDLEINQQQNQSNTTTTTTTLPTSTTSNTNNNSTHDHKLLCALYNDEEIAAVYDHNYFENGNKINQQNKQNKQIQIIAKKIVDDALTQLQNSTNYNQQNHSSSSSSFASSDENHQNILSSRERLGYNYNNSTSSTISENQQQRRFSSSNSLNSSSSLLSGLRRIQGRETTITSTSTNSTNSINSSFTTTEYDSEMTSTILTRLNKLFQQSSQSSTSTSSTTEPSLTTNEILNHFNDLPNQFAPIFREILRQIATYKNNKWYLISHHHHHHHYE